MSRAADNGNTDMLGLQNACYEYTNYFIVPGLPKNRRNRRVHIASVFLCLERTSVIIMIAEIVQNLKSPEPMRKSVYAICEQQRRRLACAFAQSDQRLCYSLPE